jgi:hypothetical protein
VFTSRHDSTPTVFWQKKGSTVTTSPAAYLLRVHTLHARQFRYISTHDYIPGPQNAMADCASRLLEISLSDFLTHFDTFFPLLFPWTGCNPRSEKIPLAITALCKRRSEPESFPRAPPKPPIRGSCGWHSVEHTTSTRRSLQFRPSPNPPSVHPTISRGTILAQQPARAS